MSSLSGRPVCHAGTQLPICPSSDQEFIRLRDGALASVLLHACIRVGEAIALTPLDLNPQAGTIIVRAGRYGARREVIMMRPGWAFVTPWLKQRSELQLSPSGPLFCSPQGFPITSGYAASLLEQVADYAGIEKRPIARGPRQTHGAQ
jgi:site-specific recombinase XerD